MDTLFEPCQKIRTHFSEYVDGECSRDVFRSIRYHAENCASCHAELRRWQTLRQAVRSAPRRQVPSWLALRLRVLASQELHRHALGRLVVRLQNAFQPLLLPASAGLLTAVIFFGVIMGMEAVPAPTLPDVPLAVITPVRVETLAPIDFNMDDDSIVIATRIAADGRVVGYTVLSGQDSPELLNHLDRLIYFSRFTPATMFGRPTGGQVVLSLCSITVRG